MSLLAEMAGLSDYFCQCVGQSLHFALVDDAENAQDLLLSSAVSETPVFLSPKRQASWRLGRQALNRINLPDTRFPAIGVSMTHTIINGGLVAIAARQVQETLTMALGIDAEPVQNRRPGLAKRILSPQELEALALVGVLTDEDWLNDSVIRLWSVKEAVWKARQSLPQGDVETLSPVTRVLIENPTSLQTAATLDGVTFKCASARLGDAWLSLAWRL